MAMAEVGAATVKRRRSGTEDDEVLVMEIGGHRRR